MTEVAAGIKENGFVALSDIEQLKGKAIVSSGAYTLLMKIKNKQE